MKNYKNKETGEIVSALKDSNIIIGIGEHNHFIVVNDDAFVESPYGINLEEKSSELKR